MKFLNGVLLEDATTCDIQGQRHVLFLMKNEERGEVLVFLRSDKDDEKYLRKGDKVEVRGFELTMLFLTDYRVSDTTLKINASSVFTRDESGFITGVFVSKEDFFKDIKQ